MERKRMLPVNKIIHINCDVKDYLEIGQFEPLQGNLKDKRPEDLDKLRKIIIEQGFDFPLFVCKVGGKNYTLDGHGRDIITTELKDEGYKFKRPDGVLGYWLPIVYVFAEDKKKAKEKLLYLNSRYGRITEEGLSQFLNENNHQIDFNSIKINLDLPELNLDKLELGKQFLKEKKEDMAPYEMAHVLISFPPNHYLEVKKFIDKLKSIHGVEIEQSAN